MRHGDERNSEGLTQRTLRGLLWSSGGTAARVLVRLLCLSILARLLSPEDFGLISTALILVGLSEMLSSLGVGPAVIQRLELEDSHVTAAFWISFTIGCLFALVLFLAAPLFSRFFQMEPLVDILRACSPLFILKGLMVVPQSLMQRNFEFGKLNFTLFISYAVGYAAIGILLALLWGNVWALVMAHLAQALFQVILLFALHPFLKQIRLRYRAIRELLSFGGKITLARMANYVALQGDYFVIGRWLGAEALGFYTRAYQLIALPANLFSEAGDKVAFSSMSKVQDQASRLNRSYKRGLGIISLTAISISGFAFVLAPEIILVLFGKQWRDVVFPFQIFSIFMFFRIAYKLSATTLRSTGAVSCLAMLECVYALLLVFGAFLGKTKGIEGVALAVGIVITLHFFFLTTASLTYTHLSIMDIGRIILPHFLITALSSLITFIFLNYLRFLQLPSILSLLFSALVFLLPFFLVLILKPRLFGGEIQWWLSEIANRIGNSNGFLHFCLRRCQHSSG